MLKEAKIIGVIKTKDNDLNLRVFIKDMTSIYDDGTKEHVFSE